MTHPLPLILPMTVELSIGFMQSGCNPLVVTS